MLPSRGAYPAARHYIAANMKTIDIKSLIIGFLLSSVLFLSMGLANNAIQDVRIVEIDKGIGASWDAINTK